MIQITCKGNSAICTRAERLTSGMVGLQCEFIFDGAWDGLAKTAVFTAGNEKRDVMLTGDTCTVPWEVLKTAGYQLVIGVYGTNAEGTLVIPTVYAMCGGIASGADPSGDESTDPTLPVWGQMQGMIGNLGNLATASKDNLVAAINEAAKSGGGSAAAYVLTLSTDEADAQANSDTVTAAIAEHGHVVLKAGKYPVKPGIVIDSGKLDMNGAHFYTVDYKSSTPLVYMKGEAPEICNGELEGSYDLADNEEGYEFFENESLIFPYGVNDAYIHHMELHNNWGYCISTGTETEKTTHYVGTATKITSNDFEFTTDAIEIPEGYKYVTASGQVGYNRIISTKNVYYHFFDEGGAELRVSNAVPKARIAIPNGAKTVKITTRLDDETFLAYNVYFTNYRESLTVSDCKFHNFHSLGLAGFEGPTNIVGCSFIESGKPRSDATPTVRATTGGVDIEDTPCPEFYMANCYSRDCAELLMFGGYKGVVTNCIGDKIGAYRGWHLGISNCNISELYTMGAYIRVSVDGVHADGVDIKEKNWKDVHGNISTNTTSPGLQCFDSFLVKMTDSNTGGGEVRGVVNGRIKCSSEVGLRLSHGFSTDKGSRLVIDSTTLGDPDVNGILNATGDIYGLESNTAVVPCGYTIHDSTFTIDELKSVWMSEVEISGAFKNCVLNMPGAPYFKNQRNANGSCSNPIDLTFTDCVINNADNYLFNFVPHAGGTVTFKNCTIADESKLFNGDASSMTVKILSGGEGGVDIDASLTVEGAAADAKAVGTALAEKMPLPASAAVGQYFVVSAVDENGAVTAVQAVDKPSGGGGSGWREVIDYTVDAEMSALTITTDKNGLPFNLREAVLFIEAVGNAETETFYSVVSTDQAVNVWWGSGTQLFVVPGLASKMERQYYIARFIALGSATLPVTAMKTSTSNYVDNFMPDRVSNGESCGFSGKNAGNYTKIDQLKFVSYARILNAGARVRLWGVDA